MLLPSTIKWYHFALLSSVSTAQRQVEQSLTPGGNVWYVEQQVFVFCDIGC